MADSIGQVQLDLVLNTSGLESQVKSAASSVSAIGKANSLSGITSQLRGLGSTAKNIAGDGFTVLKGALSGLAANGISKLTGEITSLVKSGVSYNNDLTKYTTALTTMTGSASEAAKTMGKLTDLAAKTPLEMAPLAEIETMLVQFGMSTDQAASKMKMIGDVAQGNSLKMNSIASAYGKMYSAQKVTLEQINQMIYSGFNPLTIVANKTGESMQSLYQRISAGKMSVSEITDAMETATSKGGQFYNAMERQSKTLAGQLSTLKENINALMSTALTPLLNFINAKIMPVAISVTDKLTSRIKAITGQTKQANKSVSDSAGSFTKVGSSISNMAKKASSAKTSIKKLVQEQNNQAKAEAKVLSNNSNKSQHYASIHRETTSNGTAGKKSGSKGGTGKGSGDGGDDDSDSDPSKKAKNKATELFSPIKAAWDKYGKQAIEAVKKALKEVWELIKSIGKSFKEVWLNGTGQKTVELLLKIWTSLWNIIGEVAKKLKEAWNYNSNGTKIVQALWNILNSILQVIHSILNFVLEIFSRVDLKPVLSTIAKVFTYMAKIAGIVANTVSNVNRYILNGDFSKAGNALSSGFIKAFNTLKNLLGSIDTKKLGKKLSDELSNIFNHIGDFLSGVDWGKVISTLWNVFVTVIQKVFDFLAGVDWGKVLKSLVKNIIKVVNSIINSLQIPAPFKALLKVLTGGAGAIGLTFLGGTAVLKTIIGITSGLGLMHGLAIKVATFFLTGFTRSFVAFTQIAGGIMRVVGFVGRLFSILKTVFTAVSAFAMANPIVLIIAGVVALVAAIVIAYKKSKTFRTFVNNLVKSVVSILSNIGSRIKALADNIVKWFTGAIKKIKGVWDGIVKFFEGIGKGIAGAFGYIWQTVRNFFAWLSKTKVGKGMGAIVNGIGSALSGITIPAFANGAYVKANSPQLAMIGDNRSSGEIVTPTDKMSEVFGDVLDRYGYGQSSNNLMLFQMLLDEMRKMHETIKEKDIELDGDKITKAVNKRNKKKKVGGGR